MDPCSCAVEYEGDAPRPEFVRITVRRARKEHRCGECLDPIRPGDDYEHASGKWEGDLMTMRTCAGCTNVRNRLFCGGWTYGEVLEDLIEHEIVGTPKPPPGCILEKLNAAGAEKLKQLWARELPDA